MRQIDCAFRKSSFSDAQLNYYILGVILSGAAAVPPRNRRISVQISTIFRRYLIEIPRQARDDKTRHLHFNNSSRKQNHAFAQRNPIWQHFACCRKGEVAAFINMCAKTDAATRKTSAVSNEVRAVGLSSKSQDFAGSSLPRNPRAFF